MDAIPTGISGLDELLNGGAVPGRMYLARGPPGSGKTILGMHFLSRGLSADESVLFIHGEESKADIVANAAELDIELGGADFLDLGPESNFFTGERSYDLVEPQEIDDARFIDDIQETITERDPSRVCIDPITQLRYVETSRYQFRKRLVSLARFLKDRGTTVLATRTTRDGDTDEELASLSDGVVELERHDQGRRIRVPKHRGVGQMDGTHALEIRENGVEIYPSLIPESHDQRIDGDSQFSTGIDGVDDLLHGGIEAGTATFITGPTGVGKTTLATYLLAEAAREGAKPVGYLFEESLGAFTYRSGEFGVSIDACRERGLTLEAVEPLNLSPEEFARKVERQVEERGSEFVFIDGIDAYKLSLQGDEDRLGEKLHALVRYLTNLGVTVVLTDETRRITGMSRPTSTDVSYVADNILYLSYLETDGRLRRAIGTLKKRVGGFEHTLREFQISKDGLEVGDPLTGVQGVLRGTPELLDTNHFPDGNANEGR